MVSAGSYFDDGNNEGLYYSSCMPLDPVLTLSLIIVGCFLDMTPDRQLKVKMKLSSMVLVLWAVMEWSLGPVCAQLL